MAEPNESRPFPVPDELAEILTATPELKRSYLVGGCVRDWLLGLPNKDFDVEVYDLNYERLATALTRWGRTDLVGRSFGVVKLTTGAGSTYDFTIPRRDSKTAPGHKGFEIQFDSAITPEHAAERRDFTINALMFDPRVGQVLDFVGGLADLKNRVLRHTSPAFREDPLRVLRGMQFVARFDLTTAPATLELCRSMKASYPELAPERVREEWFKWAEKSVKPSAGLKFLVASEWMEHFPEIHALLDTAQDPEWHPEGDVFVHTCHCCDALVKLPGWQKADTESKIVYILAVLAHDFAKPQTTARAERNGRLRIISPGHEELGGPIAEQFLNRINTPLAIRKRIIPLVTNHLAHLQPMTERAVRRLAKRLEPENIEGLSLVMTADAFGRPPSPPEVPEGVRDLLKMAEHLRLEASAPKPILLGRHLIELGMTPGKEFGSLLAAAFEAQLEGEFGTLLGALDWLANQTVQPLSPETRLALNRTR